MADRSPNQIVLDLSQRFESAEREFHRAYWDSQVESIPENDQRRAERELEVRRLKGDRSAFEAVESALSQEIHDPLVKRQLHILRLSLTANQMDEADRRELVDLATGVEGDFTAFRANVDGKRLSDNEIEDLLKESNDEATRRSAWFGSKQVGAVVGPRIRELVRLRNKVARDRGFPDYYRMALDLQELSEEWLFQMLDGMEEATRPAFQSYKAGLDEQLSDRFGTKELSPWHYADPFFQNLPPDGRVSIDHLLPETPAPELARRTFDAWGIDLERVMEASDMYPRERKSQHAFCLDVDRSGRDVRILANVVPGERWVEVMLHESGHAAYDASIDPQLPWVLRRAAHTFVTEAIALLSGSLLRDPVWLTKIAGAPDDEVGAIESELRRADMAQRLVFIRWGLVVCHFERDLYSDPEADLDLRWWELVERFQSVAPPPEIPKDAWAAKIHLAVAPVYYQNYLLGEALAAQLRARVESECGGFVGDRSAGDFMVDRVFRHGQLMRWDGLIESATGEPLSARQLAGTFSA